MRVTGLVSISILLAALCITSPATAQPAAEEPAAAGAAPVVRAEDAAVMPPASLSLGSPAMQEPRPVAVEGKRLSESTALALSAGGTALSWVLLVGGAQSSETLAGIGLLGTFLAPSMGHWYRGTALTRGMGARAIGFVAFGYGLLKAIGCEGGCDTNQENLLILGGMALYVGGTIDDIITAPLRVRYQNRSLQQIQLAPMVAPHSAGLALGGRF